MPLEFGTFHLFERASGDEHTAITEQIDLMCAAEELGFSSTWAAEHHFGDYGICPSSVLALAAVARQTSTIRLGTAVVVMPFHNPLRVAEELAFVDQLSAGRLDVGLGRGYRQKELSRFGIPLEETRGRFRESLQVLRKAWTEPRLTHHGQFFDYDDIEARPRPAQQPHPRVWVGSLSPQTFELVGEMGAHLLFTPRFAPDEDIPKQIGEYREAVGAAGGDPAQHRVGALRFVYCAESSKYEASFVMIDTTPRRGFEMLLCIENAGGIPGMALRR